MSYFGIPIRNGLPIGLGSLTAFAAAINSIFSPSSLFAAGEQGVWYDPSDLTTLFQDSAGTAPVTAVGQPVGKILDKSGRGNYATQATSTKRPLLQIDGNGKYYLKFDGIDDALSTGSINFTATDKMTVVAGVRKLSDAASGAIVELSAAYGLNAGAFLLSAPDSAAATTYGVGLHTSTTGYYLPSPFAAPVTNVVTELFNTAATSLISQIIPRINGVVNQAGGGGSIAAGNFGDYPLYLGSRAGTTLPFNGNLYSLIVRGAQSTTPQITSTETWVNGKTGAY